MESKVFQSRRDDIEQPLVALHTVCIDHEEAKKIDG
jgi:hypothetical protein